MQELAKILGQSITRYILPGLIFYVLIIWLPLSLYHKELITTYKLNETTTIIVIVIVTGYLLDAIGAYRYTFYYKKYSNQKKVLFKTIKELYNEKTSDIKEQDPDKYLAHIWLDNYDAYERIFDERSEWVMILISSLLFIMASIENLIFAILQPEINWVMTIILSISFLSLSYLASKTGIKRMIAHNNKVIVAVMDNLKNKTTEPNIV